MPPRLILLPKRWSTLDLPILPFLAPRVFQPWPRKGRRVYSAATQSARQKFEESGFYHGERVQDNSEGGNLSPVPTEKKGSLRSPSASPSLSNAPNYVRSPPQGVGASYGETIERHSHNAKPFGALEDDFSRVYKEVWGSPKKRISAKHTERKRELSYSNVMTLSSVPRRQLWTRPPWPTRARSIARAKRRTSFMRMRKPTRVRGDLASRSLRRVRSTQTAQQQQIFLRAQIAASKRRFFAGWLQRRARWMEIPDVRAKWARYVPGAGTGLHGSFDSWHQEFMVLNFRYERFMHGRSLPNYAVPKAPNFPASFIRHLVEHKSSETLSLEWETFGARQRMEIWPELMIATLRNHPEKALKVLAGTYNQAPFPAAFALSDCVNYVISYYFDDPVTQKKLGRPDTLLVEQIFNYVFHLLRQGPKDYLQISQNSTQLLIKNVAHKKLLKDLYMIMSDLNHPMHENTLIQFGYALAKCGETELVFSIMERLKTLQSDFNTPKILSLCSAVLDASNRPSDDSGSDSDILEYMLQRGMEPNIIHYNILLKNALQRGDHSTGWQLHDMMIESGLEPDAYTYSLLLNDSKLRMDSESITTVMDLVREKGIKSNYIVTDVIHAICLLHRQRTETHQPSEPQVAFRDMLKVYLENFRMEPLANIIPWISEILPQAQNTPSQDELEYPPAPPLALMISAFLNELHNPLSVKKFYSRFRELLSTGDPAVANLLKTTHVWDAIIMSFGKFEDSLRECPAVIGDMLNPAKVSAVPENSRPGTDVKAGSDTNSSYSPLKVKDWEAEAELDTGLIEPANASTPNPEPADLMSLQSEILESELPKPHVPPKPSVYTWSVLLHVFGRNRQTRAAERVLKIMQEKGIEPSIVTWNSLLDSYASIQDTEMAVDVVSRMEASGIETDEITMQTLRKIRDRQGVVEAMKRKTNLLLASERSFVKDLHTDLEEEIRDNLVHGMENLLKRVRAKASDSRKAELSAATAAPENAPVWPHFANGPLSPAQLPLRPVFEKKYVFKDLLDPRMERLTKQDIAKIKGTKRASADRTAARRGA